jgi:hypothetical protein
VQPGFLHDDETTEHYVLNEKVTKNISKQTDGFKSQHTYIVPIEHIGLVSKSFEEAFRSVVIRREGEN